MRWNKIFIWLFWCSVGGHLLIVTGIVPAESPIAEVIYRVGAILVIWAVGTVAFWLYVLLWLLAMRHR